LKGRVWNGWYIIRGHAYVRDNKFTRLQRFIYEESTNIFLKNTYKVFI
jgi:hypothetical protein